MKTIRLSYFVSWTVVLLSFASSTWAGEVVTPDVKLWAKKALEEEKSLTVSPSAQTVAVLYFQNRTGKSNLDPIQKGLAVMLITDLSNVPGVQVIERIRLLALVEEMGLGVSGLVDQETAPRVGKLLGAHWLVGGTMLGPKKEDLRIESTALDVPAQQVVGQAAAEGMISQLFRIEKDLLFDIIRLLKIEITPLQRQELMKPCSSKTTALLSLFRAVDASDRRNYEMASEFYEKALKEDPGICTAQAALQELKRMGLSVVRRRGPALLHDLRNETSQTNQLGDKETTRYEFPTRRGPDTPPCPACR